MFLILMKLQAAKHAGIFPVTLIKEPEAAAMYTLHELQDRSLAVSSLRDNPLMFCSHI